MFNSRLTSAVLRADFTLADHCARRRPPRWVRALIVAASRGGDGWLWCVAGVLVLSFGGRDRLQAFECSSLAAMSAVLLFVWLKRRIGRPRPHRPHVWARLAAPDRFSFPSGHTITAFAVCAALWRFYPGWGLVLWPLAAAVAVSRLLLGLHYLTDVLAGLVLGLALGLAWFQIVAASSI